MYNHKEYMKIYNAKNRNKRRVYRKNNKEKIELYNKEYRKNHINRFKEYRDRCLKSWEGYIPKITKCQLCGKNIFFNSGDGSKSISFDHRSEGAEVIRGSPTHWLASRVRTPENERIWESCNFGMLCQFCNKHIPTIGRVKFSINLNKYVKKKRKVWH